MPIAWFVTPFSSLLHMCKDLSNKTLLKITIQLVYMGSVWVCRYSRSSISC